jgi:hypothetical protein
MSQISRHIAAVRWRYSTEQFLLAASWALILCAAVAILILLIRVPHPYTTVGVLFIAAMAAAAIHTVRGRISTARTAAMIDQRLDLKERLSTAVCLGDRQDEFAQTIRADAEDWAGRINLRGKFPIRIPWVVLAAVAAMGIAAICWWLLPQSRSMSRAGQQAALNQQASRQVLQQAASKIEAQAKTFGSDSQIQQARRDLEKEMSAPPKDPAIARRDAAKAMQQFAQAAGQRSAKAQALALAQNNALRQLNPVKNQTGGVAEAHRALAHADPHSAEQAIAKTVQESKRQTPAQRQEAGRQMHELAAQLHQVAQNNQKQQALASQLHQLGFNSGQVQQMRNQPESAVRKMIGRLQPALSSQQQEQAARLMQRLSAEAQAHQQMQAMSKSAEQMAQAMQENKNAQMTAAAQAMQRQLNQMQAEQQSARQQSEQARAARESADQSMQSLNQGGQPTNNGGPGRSSSGPPVANGQSQNPGGSSGIGREHEPLTLGQPKNQPAFSIRVESPPPGQNVPAGKILADFLVKGDVVKGKAQQQLQTVVAAARQQAAEDADQESIDAAARQTVKRYFQAVQDNR